MGENDQEYDAIAREAIEHALGRTFENPEAVPRRDAFIRDATDLLARFVAARCGNPGFHSARFFDAVIALSNARSRIRDAARRSRVVERLVEAERRVRSLEVALRDRNEQLVQASKGDVGTLARALSEADQRIRTLERELTDARNAAAGAEDAASSRESGEAGRPTLALERLDADEIFENDSERESTGEPRTGRAQRPDLVLDPERRLVEAKAEREELVAQATRLRSDKEQVELERDALQAQLDQLVEREKGIREAKAAIGRERDALLLRIQELERAATAARAEAESAGKARGVVERDLDEVVRSRSALAELKRSIDQELVLAQKERDTARAELADREAARARAEAAATRAEELRKEADERAARESVAAARSRRERDDARVERDRLRAVAAELEAVRAVHAALLGELGLAPGASLEAVHESLARRHEIVLAHEPPDWDAAAAVLARARDEARTPAEADDAKARLERLTHARTRYEALATRAETGTVLARELVELVRLLDAHERDLALARSS